MEKRGSRPAQERAAGKTVVITGASSGIGRATALKFARQGSNLVLIARREQVLRELAAECEGLGARVMVAADDVADADAIQRTARQAVTTFGKIDVWVNNAAVTMFSRFEETPPAAFKRLIDTNLIGYFNGARAVLPFFRERGTGVLINMSSVAGRVPQPYTGAYTASKFAVNGLSESLRAELKDAPGVHVCTVLAPSTDTPLFQHGANYMGRAPRPIRPVYPAERVADTIVHLAEKPKREAVVGAGKAMLLMETLMPARMEKLMFHKMRRDHFQDASAPAGEGNLFRPMEGWNSVSGGWLEQKGGAPMIKKIAIGAGIAGAAVAAYRYRKALGRIFLFRRSRGVFGKGIALLGIR